MSQHLKKIDTANAPSAIGPYSQGIEANGFVFVSGQLPINPKTNVMVERNIAAQTKQVLDNVEAILKESGLTFNDVVKSEVFLKDMQDFKEMNAIYAERFSGSIKPARQAFQVAMLPLDALVEISCIAAKK
ncbi:MAG: Rid family detoxifying hydrolase [Chlamydiae bacterium]|nr:Rid family detoxifying hydrolase [Chlamydiota bacterium]